MVVPYDPENRNLLNTRMIDQCFQVDAFTEIIVSVVADKGRVSNKCAKKSNNKKGVLAIGNKQG